MEVEKCMLFQKQKSKNTQKKSKLNKKKSLKSGGAHWASQGVYEPSAEELAEIVVNNNINLFNRTFGVHYNTKGILAKSMTDSPFLKTIIKDIYWDYKEKKEEPDFNRFKTTIRNYLTGKGVSIEKERNYYTKIGEKLHLIDAENFIREIIILNKILPGWRPFDEMYEILVDTVKNNTISQYISENIQLSNIFNSLAPEQGLQNNPRYIGSLGARQLSPRYH